MRLLLLAMVLATGTAGAEFYQSPLLETQWNLQTGKLSCRLSQTIPHLGHTAFEQDAGEPLRFLLILDNENRVNEASLQILPAPWQHQFIPGRLYDVATIPDSGRLGQNLGVQGEIAERMLVALYSGRFPSFSFHRSWQGGASEARVTVSAVHFWQKYDAFQDCRHHLPPFGRKDFQGLRYHFIQHQVSLPDALRNLLPKLAAFLQLSGGGQVVVRNETAGVAGKEGLQWFRKRYAEVQRSLLAAGLASRHVSLKASTADIPKFELTLFGPEGLHLYHYGRHQRGLTSAQKRRLSLLARYVREFFPGNVIIHAYSDGARWRSEKANRNLARNWAVKIRDFLVGKGVDIDRMHVQVWGSRHRIASNLSRAGQAKNRRVVIELSDMPVLTAARH